MTAPLPIVLTAGPSEVSKRCGALLAEGKRVHVATVAARQGSTPGTPGQKLLLWRECDAWQAMGTVGGGAVEMAVLQQMLGAAEGKVRGATLQKFRLGAQLGMCCGGSMDVLMENMGPDAQALIVGAGHIGRQLVPLLLGLGFQVTWVAASGPKNEDAQFSSSQLNPDLSDEPGPLRPLADAAYDDPAVLASQGIVPERAALVVMTHDHQLDQEVVEWALGRGFAFVGGVGSRAKAVRTAARLEAKGFSAEQCNRVRMPVGVSIGARSPQEIAVAIAAELIAWRAGEKAPQ